MDLSERKLKILQVIIDDYVANAEPVGSRSIAKKYALGISPATIRNEMADLEDLGLLTHPHTSAGRVPSEKAYRLYVNDLMKKGNLTEEEKLIIKKKLNADKVEFDEAIRHAAALLSEITKLASFITTPYENYDTIAFIKLVPIDERTIVIMIVSESGHVTNQTLRLDLPYTDEALEILSKSMTYHYKGHTITDVVRQTIISDIFQDIKAMSTLADMVMPNFVKVLEDMLNVNLYMEGLTNIFNIPEYASIDKAKTFMELLSRKEKFAKDIAERDDGIIVTIGSENGESSMEDFSLVTATYHVDGKLIGKLGVIGPTRMDYGKITSIMEYVTDNLSNAFKIKENKKNE